MRGRLPLSTMVLCAMAACRTGGTTHHAPAGNAPVLTLAPHIADTVRSERISARAVLHTIVNRRAPWQAYVLEVHGQPCVGVRAVKGARTAEGRRTTTQLLRTLADSLDRSSGAFAAVNADFFLFAPPGVPTNLHLEQGRVIAGPGPNPVFWNDASGTLRIDTLVARGEVRTARGALAFTAWNRPAPRNTGVVDAAWGIPFDTTMRSARVLQLIPLTASGQGNAQRYRARSIPAIAAHARGDTLLLHLASAITDDVLIPRDGDTVTVQHALSRRHVTGLVDARNAVGGRPMLLADSVILPDVDTEGNDGFRGLNPRTAVGIDRAGQRLWLAVIDGRQAGYSMGMTLRQTAELMQALGATRALNLDGGGSSAMVLRDPETGTTRTVNRPSDAGGERPVANALAVSATCRHAD